MADATDDIKINDPTNGRKSLCVAFSTERSKSQSMCDQGSTGARYCNDVSPFRLIEVPAPTATGEDAKRGQHEGED